MSEDQRPGVHTLVIETPDPDEYDEHLFEVTCSGVTDSCRAWYECTEDGHPDPVDVDYDEVEAHGVTHHWVNGAWVHWTDLCLAVLSWPEGSDHYDIATKVGHVPGTYPVKVEFDEDYLYMTLQPDGTVAP